MPIDMLQIGLEVTALFGGNYTCEKLYEPSVIIRNKKDSQWGIILANRDGKIVVSGKYPTAKDKTTFADSGHSIKVAETRKPKDIYSEIMRRFIADFDDEYVVQLLRVAEHNEYLDRLDAMAERFTALTGGNVMNHDKSRHTSRYFKNDVYLKEMYLSASNNTVNINLWHVPADLAEQIINLLKNQES